MLFVVIVDDPSLGLQNDNFAIHGDVQGVPCKHLRGDTPGHYECSLHNEPWYHLTDCSKFTQMEKKNQNCRLGAGHMEAYRKDKSYFKNFYELAYRHSIFFERR